MPPPLSPRQAHLVINGLPHLGPVTLRRLLDVFHGDVSAVFGATRDQLKSVKGVGDKVVDTLHGWDRFFDLEKQERQMEQGNVDFVLQEEEAYPPLLREIYDPPIGLYWKGDYRLERPGVAIVGSRKTSLYGRHTARKLGQVLAKSGFCVVSGMARGVDTEAHKGALEVDGKTIAVLGSGLDTIYPAENIDLYREIAATGAVVSEFPFGRRADRQTFPMRNRIVSGMCQAIVVVESDVNGGSMITARFAAEQGRTVFAVPGRIDQSTSRGCHQLIREGAVLLSRPEDVVEDLAYLLPATGQGELEMDVTAPKVELSQAEAGLLRFFDGGECLGMDQLLDKTGLSSPEVASVLLMLEIKGVVKKRFDGRFEALGVV